MVSTANVTPDSQTSIQAAEIDGVRVLWAPAPPPLRASLVFRVGMADETLPIAGTTHLIEHLALFGLGRRCYGYNGFTAPGRTSFVVAGDEAEVVEYLADVTTALSDLPLDRLEAEARVLRTEADGRGRNWAAAMLAYRYGARGFGLAGHREYGLEHLEAADVEAWASRYFNAGNAVLWLSGPPPANLRLHLPQGDHHEIPTPRPIPFAAPAWLHERTQGVGLALEARRSVALSIALRIGASRLEEKLRRDLGVTYHVASSWMPLTGHLGHAVISADALPDHVDDAKTAFLATLEHLALLGPTEKELNEDIASTRRGLNDPESVLGMLDFRATQELFLGPVTTSAQLLAEMEALTTAEIGAALGEALETALLALPHGVEPPAAGFHAFPMWSEDRVRGWAHAATRSGSFDRLVLGHDGASLIVDDARAVTVRFDQCEAALRWDDGSRGLWSYDGFYLHLRPWEWTSGEEMVKTIDGAVPADRWVHMGEGEGPPSEERHAAQSPPAAPAPPAFAAIPPPPRAAATSRPLGLLFIPSVLVVAFLWLVVAALVPSIFSPGPDEDSFSNALATLFVATPTGLWTRSLIRRARR